LHVVVDVFRWCAAFKAAHCRLTVRQFGNQTDYGVLFDVTLIQIPIHYKNADTDCSKRVLSGNQ
jgi:hypothetical protein